MFELQCYYKIKYPKFGSWLLALSFISPLAADVDLTEIPKNGWGKSSPIIASSTPPFYQKQSSPKKTKPKSKDLFLIEGGAVYLRPYQGGTDFIQVVNISDLEATIVPPINTDQKPYGKNKPLDFHFDWGARGSIGYQGGQSRQTFKATYLYFQSEAHKSASISTNSSPTQFLFCDFFVSINTVMTGFPFSLPFTYASSRWDLHLNMLDITFGKKYPRKGCMNFEPYVGAKGILLDEEQSYLYTIPLGVINSELTTSKLKQTVNFKGVGPVGGLNLDWAMTSWLSFKGSVAAALLYSSVETKRTSNNALPTLAWIGSSHDIKGSPVLEASLALRSVYCFKRGQFIELKVGFEDHYIFEVMKHNLQNADNSTNLNLMGWFATLGFGF